MQKKYVANEIYIHHNNFISRKWAWK